MKNRELLSEVAAGVLIAAVMFGCTSLYLTTLADACGPAAHQATYTAPTGRPTPGRTSLPMADSSETSGAESADLVAVWEVQR